MKVAGLARTFSKEFETQTPDPTKCLDLLNEMGKGISTIDASSVEKSNVNKVLSQSVRYIWRCKRNKDQSDEWESVLTMVNKMLDNCKTLSEKKPREASNQSNSSKPGEPTSVAEYRTRLVSQKKEIYKDPPVLPPTNIKVESSFCPLPKRNNDTGELSFAANDSDVKKLLKDFHPNRTPEEVLRAGSFGGTYFRPINSAVTNIQYKAMDVLRDTIEKDWIRGLPLSQVTSKTYRKSVNKYGAKCGGSLGMWESSGWITYVDPYGWFQWYCRFYRGRRCEDDARQISRWLKSAGPKGRFRSQLCNKILSADSSHDDKSISPVIRQTLLHWGLEITPQVLAKHAKRVGR
eukprot:scaffold1966_cov109-Cylindrotheca_fusiformis.AAC.2